MLGWKKAAPWGSSTPRGQGRNLLTGSIFLPVHSLQQLLCCCQLIAVSRLIITQLIIIPASQAGPCMTPHPLRRPGWGLRC